MSSVTLVVVALYAFFLQTLFFKMGLFTDGYLTSVAFVGNSLMGYAWGALISGWVGRRWRPFSGRLICLLFLAGWLCFIGLLNSPDETFLMPWVWPVFGISGLLISFAFQTGLAGRNYLIEMLGCGLAAVLFYLLIPRAGMETAFLVMQALVATLALLSLKGREKLIALCFISFSLTALFVHTENDVLNLSRWTACRNHRSPRKIFCYPKLVKDVQTFESLGQRIDLLQHRGTIGVFYDGYLNDVILPDAAEAYRKDPRVIDGLQNRPRVLVIGAAAEGILKPLKAQTEAGRILAFEHNPALIQLMQNDFFEFSARAYEGVQIVGGNVLPFLFSQSEKFDLITLMNTHNVKSAKFIGGPEFLHTFETVQRLFSMLSENGFIAIEERNNSEIGVRSFQRIVKTFQAAMRAAGNDDPWASTFLYHWSNKRGDEGRFHSAFFKKGKITSEERNQIQRWISLPNESIFARQTRLRLGFSYFPDEAAKKEDLGLITDDRPFLLAAEHSFEQLWDTLLWPFLLGIVGLLMLVGMRFSSRVPSLQWSEMGLAGFSGAGFLLIELILTERYTRFLEDPARSYILILLTMLVSAGLGGYFCARLDRFKIRGLMLVGIVLTGLHGFILEGWIERLLQSGIPISPVLALGIAPLAFVLGAPLPYVLRRIRERLPANDAAISWALAQNLFCSAVAAMAAPLIAFVFGYRVAFVVAMLIYGVAVVICPGNQTEA